MPRKQPKKKPKKASPKKKASKKSIKSPSKKPTKKTKVKKAVARSAVRKAVAKRAKKTKKQTIKKTVKKTVKKKSTKKITKKKPTRKAAKKVAKSKSRIVKKKAKAATKVKKKKPAKKSTSKRGRAKTVLRKPAARKKASLRKAASKKKPVKKAAKKSAKLKAAKKPVSPKPKIKEKKPPVRGPERALNKAEISKLLSDAYTRHLIIESGGEHALEIVRGFNNNSSDEEMCKKLGIKISDVRATLNKLHALGIVDYTRHKDSETGWFSYYWCLNVNRMKCWVNDQIEDERRKQDFSDGEHYFCPNCGGASIHDFVSASDFGFKCPTCSSALDFLSEKKSVELFPMKVFRKPLL